MFIVIGANSVLLPRAVSERSVTHPNRLESLTAWLRDGGGLVMIGGYLSLTGFEAKAALAGTPVEDVLPVTCLDRDDRIEAPQGMVPTLILPDHPALGGLAGRGRTCSGTTARCRPRTRGCSPPSPVTP